MQRAAIFTPERSRRAGDAAQLVSHRLPAVVTTIGFHSHAQKPHQLVGQHGDEQMTIVPMRSIVWNSLVQ